MCIAQQKVKQMVIDVTVSVMKILRMVKWTIRVWSKIKTCDKVFKSVISKSFKGCLPQNLLSPLLHTLSPKIKALI